MQRGFTIIETVLFLAVTGLLVLGVLASTGVNIAIQRYRDSVTSLQDVLRDQFSQTDYVANATTEKVSCSNAVVGDTGTLQSRGQSQNCVIIGRYIEIVDTDITTSTVIGSGDSSIAANDITDLQGYSLELLPGSTETRALEWGARIAWPETGVEAHTATTPRSIAILILRSPVSGTSYVFTGNTVGGALESLVVAGNTVPGQADRRICVDSNGGVFDEGLAVYINAYATSVGSIEMRSNDMGDGSSC